MTSLKSLETFLPTELLKDLEALAVEEGRDVEAVVAAAVRRYLWDSTFRTLRRHAQARSRVQGWVSDQSILTTVLATRRPDEFTLTKTEESHDAVAGEAAEGEDAQATTQSSPNSTRIRETREFRDRKDRRERREPREPRESREAPRAFREPRERPTETDSARRPERSLASPRVDEPVEREDREESGGRRPRRRVKSGRREDVADVRDSSSPAESAPRVTTDMTMPPPSYAVSTPNVDHAAMRRRTESMHRFLPPDPTEREQPRETHESDENREPHESREPSESHEGAPREVAQRAPRESGGHGRAPTVRSADSSAEPFERSASNPSWSRPSPSSSVSASDSPDSRPDSPAVPSPSPDSSPTTPSSSFGRKPKRSGRR